MDRAQYLKFAKVDTQHWWFQARRNILSFLMRNRWPEAPPGFEIVDIGTGTGGMLPVLCQWGHLTATEPDHDTLVLTQEHFAYLGDRVTFKEGGWEELNLPANGFDLLTSFDVLEHCEDDRKALRTWGSWLKTGGTLILMVPAFPSLWGLNDEISHHYRRYTRSTLLQALAESDFKIQKISYINSLMFVPVWLSRNIKDRIQRRFSKENTPMPWDFDVPAAAINFVLERTFSCETLVLNHVDLPWGTSLLVVAERKN